MKMGSLPYTPSETLAAYTQQLFDVADLFGT